VAKAAWMKPPGAYKDIAVVMENQADLVDIRVQLKPLAVIKG
jgi:RNA-splicing ligase RtcB